MAPFSTLRSLLLLALLAPAAASCAALEPPLPVFTPRNEPLARCEEQCVHDAGKVCSAKQCERGCAFVLDRLVEGVGPKVIGCVAGQKAAEQGCSDRVFAECAARVDRLTDGGPAAPKPREDDDDE
jgi:hypothetical protein